jgi:multiple sugar transport system substrate-binding protein
MKMQRILGILLILIVVATWAFGAGQKEGVKGGTLVGIVPQGRHEEASKLGVAAFQQKYPEWKVDLSVAPDWEQKVKIQLGAKENLDFFWSAGSDYPRIWGEQNALVAMDQYMKNDGINILEFYEKPYVDELKYKGEQLILPTDCFTYALWYNKVIFDAAGVPVPAYNKSYSWEELLDVAKKCTMDRTKDGVVDTWGLSLYSPVWHIVQPWYNSAGARLCSPDGKKASGYIDSPAFKDFLTKYRDLMGKYGVARPLNIPPDGDSWTETWTNGYLNGNCAMLVGAPWTVNEANRMEEQSPDKFKWGTALPPRMSGDKPYSIGGTAGWAIPYTCPDNKRQAAFRICWELSALSAAKWWYDNNLMYATKEGLAKFMNQDKNKYGGWVEAVKYLVPMEQISIPAWKEAVESVLPKTISVAFFGKMDVDEAVKQAAKQIDEGIARYEARK